jgi:hypothetical protein
LFLQLFVQAAFEFADFAATQAGDVDVIPRPVSFVVVPVAAKMQQIQLVDQALLFKKINRAVNSDEVHARIDFLRSLENLIHVQMLLGVIHHLQDDSALPGHANAAGSHSLLNPAGCLGGIEALTGGNPVRR